MLEAASNIIMFNVQPDVTVKPNEPDFDDHRAAVCAEGTLQVSWARVRVAIHDPRLLRQHLKVLAELLECLNSKDGTAWPSRETLGERCGLNARTVQNILYDLRKYHYVVWEKRSTEAGRRLVHYTVPLAQTDYVALRSELDRYLANLHSRPCEKSARPVMQQIAQPAMHARPAVQKTALPAVQKRPLPAVQQEPTYEPTKEKRSEECASAIAEGAVHKAVRQVDDAVRGTRLATDWVLPKPWGEWALKNFDVSPHEIRCAAQDFKDHWLSTAGAKGRKADWNATWRKWCGSHIQNWKRRRPMTTKIAPDLLDTAQAPQAPQDQAYLAELAQAARSAREAAND